jgi:hypothetical protein
LAFAAVTLSMATKHLIPMTRSVLAEKP